MSRRWHKALHFTRCFCWAAVVGLFLGSTLGPDGDVRVLLISTGVAALFALAIDTLVDWTHESE